LDLGLEILDFLDLESESGKTVLWLEPELSLPDSSIEDQIDEEVASSGRDLEIDDMLESWD